MPALSVLIAGRNECFFDKTIESVLAAAQGDTEVIAVIDGEHLGPPIKSRDRLRIIVHDTPQGQRQSINEAAEASEAKFILKTDAHSMFDEGFDVKLMARCEYDWTVLPRMRHIHAFDLVCDGCGRRLDNHRNIKHCEACGSAKFHREDVWRVRPHKKVDWMWFRSPSSSFQPLRIAYWDGPVSREFPTEYAAHKQWAKGQGEIADVMTGQGACWFMHRERFWELGGLDAAGHGSWGQMGVEMACKAWLSGGRHVVNRSTWFAHFFRCGSGPKFPYTMRPADQERTRRYSIKFWTEGKWDKQVRPLEWLVEKFWPVPTWDKSQLNLTSPEPAAVVNHQSSIINDRSPLVSVLIPARNEQYLARTVADLHEHLATDYEILVGLDGSDEHSERPPDHSRLRIIQSDERIGMRPLINRLARAARGQYLIRMDAHCMVAEGFDRAMVDVAESEGHVTVVARRYDLDAKRWKRRDRTDNEYRYLTHESEDGIGLRSMAWNARRQGRASSNYDIDETMTCSGSSWTCKRSTFVDWWGGFDESHGTFGQEGCEISCMTWLSGGRLLVNKTTWYAHHNRGKSPYSLGHSQKPQSIEYSHDLWRGDNWKHQKYSFQWLLDRFAPVPGWPDRPAASILEPIRMGALTKGMKKVGVADLWQRRRGISEPDKVGRLDIFWNVFFEFVQSCLAAKPDLEGRYAEYLRSHLSRAPVTTLSARQQRKIHKKLQSAVTLVASIKTGGLKAPLEFYSIGSRLILWKGYRRLAILKALGVEQITCRVFADKHAAGTLSPATNLTRLTEPAEDTLHRLGAEQFRTMGHDGTDKYWVHGYTRYYDRHFAALRKRAKKVLEAGLLRGASLKLWRDYFPTRTEIVGADIHPSKWRKYAGDLANSKVFLGDETDGAFCKKLADYGPYDVIVDDASHQPEIQRQLFKQLWPNVRQYGYYVIEDIYRSYRLGGDTHCLRPNLDWDIYIARDVAAIHHYYNIVFIQKA